jgi:hypothetical protein
MIGKIFWNGDFGRWFAFEPNDRVLLHVSACMHSTLLSK